MYLINKKIGETPLQALENFRRKKGLKKEALSYIGRLDPMAEGKMMIISGEENKNREKYLYLDKEYLAEFVIGMSTDSLDVLGLVKKPYGACLSGRQGRSSAEKESITRSIKIIKDLKTQKYPWFSGKTINGIKMFDIFKSGKIKGVKRPTNKIKIKKISVLRMGYLAKSKTKKDILEKIKKVKGDFRQKDIVKNWKEFFNKTEIDKFQKFSVKIQVSSGTFIRGFVENFERELKLPVLLYNLKRTKIFNKE